MEELNNKYFLDRFLEVDPILKHLYIEGSLAAGPYLTVVGPRKPTNYSVSVITQFIAAVAPYCTVVSGLAYGIDILALKTAVHNGGKVLCICPTGINNIQPTAHKNFISYMLVQKKGALISEHKNVKHIYKNLFLLRNRLLAAAADVVFAPEAAFKSGTHNTLKQAVDLNKIVATVPAEIYSQKHELTNKLLSTGAQVILHPDDILGLLNLDTKIKKNDERYKLLIEVLKTGEFEPTNILDKLNISVGDFASLILEAEADKILQRDETGKIFLV